VREVRLGKAKRRRRVADSKIAAKRQNGMRDNQVDLSSVLEGRGDDRHDYN
jgi:hypothetical protein